MPLRASILVSAALVAAVSVGASAAQTPGATVRDSRGEVLGKIERVVTDSAGRPAQVVVRSRTTGGARSELRALPASTLRPSSDGYATPLRKREFEILPVLKR